MFAWYELTLFALCALELTVTHVFPCFFLFHPS